MCFKLISFWLIVLFLWGLVYAQQAPEYSGHTPTEISLSLGVLIFGIILLGLEIGVMLKAGRSWGAESVRISGLTLVIVAGIFLITAGYSQNQIAPMIGLLGTIAGYLLGKTGSKE